MIRRLVLNNWRAYQQLDLAFREGVSFVVAGNSIGKSSIVMGAAWGLLGEASAIDSVSCIRGEADYASVQMELELKNRVINIERSVSRNGKAKSEVLIDGSRVADSLQLLREEFQVDPAIMGRLAFMTDGSHIDSSSHFELRDHLYRAFGVSDLIQAADLAGTLANEARRARESLRKVVRRQSANTEEIERAIASFDEELTTLNNVRPPLERAVKDADTARKMAHRWADYQAAGVERESRIRELLAKTHEFATEKNFEEALTRMRAAEEELESQLGKMREEAAGHEARWSAAQRAGQRLVGTEAVCPTCLRPITPEEASHAIHEHEVTATASEKQVTQVRRAASELEERLDAIKNIFVQLRDIPGLPPAPGTAETDVDDAERNYAHSLRALQDHERRAAELRGRRDQLAADLRVNDAALAEEMAQVKAYRREAITAAAAEVLRKSADSMIAERIDPLTRDVARRWKRMFGTGDLILYPDGRITRKIGSRELQFKELSGGERIWALLVTRLLVLAASTRVPFAWLDEPLEHLDPRLRRIVGGTLVRAVGSGGLRQLVVTTYEEGLARQLAEDNEMAELITVREGQQGSSL